MLAWLWNKLICDHKLSHLCFTNREKVDVQDFPFFFLFHFPFVSKKESILNQGNKEVFYYQISKH